MKTWLWLLMPAVLLAQVNVPYERTGLTAASHRQRGYAASPCPTGLLPQYCFCPRLVYDAVRDAVSQLYKGDDIRP